MSHAKGRAASGFRPKLHSRVESLSLESLGHESLRGPRKSKHTKIWSRKSRHGSQKSGHRLSLPMSRLWRPNFGMSRLSQPMSSFSQPNFGMSRLSRPTARLMSRLSRLKFSARLCNLGLNPDVARPLKSGHESGTSTRVAEAYGC